LILVSDEIEKDRLNLIITWFVHSQVVDLRCSSVSHVYIQSVFGLYNKVFLAIEKFVRLFSLFFQLAFSNIQQAILKYMVNKSAQNSSQGTSILDLLRYLHRKFRKWGKLNFIDCIFFILDQWKIGVVRFHRAKEPTSQNLSQFQSSMKVHVVINKIQSYLLICQIRQEILHVLINLWKGKLWENISRYSTNFCRN